jgi:hypothetical protein
MTEGLRYTANAAFKPAYSAYAPAGSWSVLAAEAVVEALARAAGFRP